MSPNVSISSGFFGLLILSLGLGTTARAQQELNSPDQSLISAQHVHQLTAGTNLDGWIIRGGKASYVLTNGMIVGTTTVKGGGNTFLCTQKDYGDFVLELDVKADEGLNSGVQIRSHCYDTATTYDAGDRLIKIPADRVHGYQVEVDHRPERRWSGGIYEEARRDWLFPLPANSPAGQAFKFGDWNHYRIQCIGPAIKTWVNGVAAADFLDTESLGGFIGLQVHATDTIGAQVRFRDVRVVELGAHEWRTAWNVNSLDDLDQLGPGVWTISNQVLQARQQGSDSVKSTLLSSALLHDLTVQFKYKIMHGGFTLAFQPAGSAGTGSDFELPITAAMGTNHVAHLQDWNTLTFIAQNRRVVAQINGRVVHQGESSVFDDGVHPALILPGAVQSDVFFKDFQILTRVE